MSAETLFTLANLAVLPAWLLLAVAPRWKGTLIVTRTLVVPLLCAAAYVTCLVVSLTGGAEGGIGSLAEVRQLFESDVALLMGWLHYLAFDLFVGTWIAQDAQRHGVHHGVVVPSLILTLMVGPTGLLTYWLLRGLTRGVWRTDSPTEGQADAATGDQR